MKHIILPIALALSLPGCAGNIGIPNIPAAPVEVADKTTLDERGAIAAEVAYKALRTAVEFATDAGMLTGANAKRAAHFDNLAFAAVSAARAAYRAGNAESYKAAVDEALKAVGAALASIKGA